MKVAFLDRDGVINEEVNYLHQKSEFRYTHRCIEALQILKNEGFQIIIVTNQAGIAKGYFSITQYHSLMRFILNDLLENGINILDVFFCPHHEEGVIPEYSKKCFCRKPKPGLFLNAISKYNINLSESFVVGDKVSDIEAGRAAGLKKLFLVKTGHLIEDGGNLEVFENLYSVSLFVQSG